MKIKKNTLWMAGICLVVVFLLYFVFANSGTGTKFGNDSNTGEVQKVVISYKNSNYYPQTIKVKAGQPVEMTLDSTVGGCFRSFTIPAFGISQYSKTPSETIKFTPDKTGTFQFACSMGMGRGTLIVE